MCKCILARFATKFFASIFSVFFFLLLHHLLLCVRLFLLLLFCCVSLSADSVIDSHLEPVSLVHLNFLYLGKKKHKLELEIYTMSKQHSSVCSCFFSCSCDQVESRWTVYKTKRRRRRKIKHTNAKQNNIPSKLITFTMEMLMKFSI